MEKRIYDLTGDPIIDGVDEETVVPKVRSFLRSPRGVPMTGDDLIAALEALPDRIRQRPLIVAVDVGDDCPAYSAMDVTLDEVSEESAVLLVTVLPL